MSFDMARMNFLPLYTPIQSWPGPDSLFEAIELARAQIAGLAIFSHWWKTLDRGASGPGWHSFGEPFTLGRAS